MTEMVRAEQVCKSFGALQVLKGVTLSVDRGQVLVLVGLSGSGKSTSGASTTESVSAGRLLYVDGELVGYRASGSSTRCRRGRRPNNAVTSAWSFSTSISSR